jgi:RND superfamily putative drug exporter
LSTDRKQALFNIYPTSGPSSPQRGQLLERLRGPVRAALDRRGVTINIGGSDATSVDLAHAVTHSMPYAFAAVIGISLLLLFVLFRSVVVAAKAGAMNLLSVAAAFGVVVAVFQWGWGLRLLGVDYAGPIEVFLPLLLFPVVFGLSMDYEVFLVSRIRDEWDRTGDNQAAVTEGLATTGRVVTTGAAIMVVLFASLVFASARTVKMFGLAMAVAIALDALVVRSVLLPATMQLLGRYNWWLPSWLEARLPRLVHEDLAARVSTPEPTA